MWGSKVGAGRLRQGQISNDLRRDLAARSIQQWVKIDLPTFGRDGSLQSPSSMSSAQSHLLSASPSSQQQLPYTLPLFEQSLPVAWSVQK
jgi:hypothetical protein